MRSFIFEAAVLASLLPQSFSLALASDHFVEDAAPAAGLPEYFHFNGYPGNKYRRMQHASEAEHIAVEHMIRDFGIYHNENVERSPEAAHGNATTSGISSSESVEETASSTTLVFAPTQAAANITADVLAKHHTKTKTSSAKKTSATKTSIKKTSAAKTSAKKTSVTKSATKTTATKKSSSKKPVTKATSKASVVEDKVAGSTYPAGASTMTAIITPSVVTYTMLGAPTHNPASSYLSGQSNIPVPTLPSNLMVPQATVEAALAAKPINKNTGTLVINTGNENELAPLQWTPNYSRDQGKGGTINGQSFFIFADTNTFGPTSGGNDGSFTGAVSNSVAMDLGMQPAHGQSLQLRDPMGAYASANGALRGFVPFTQGESYFNGKGNGRIAIWPESSIIPLTGTSALQYAPLVYINGSGYYFAGTTMYEITIPSEGGPVANRVATRLFDTSSGVEWGCLGGLRSYGSSGTSGGNVYIFGNHPGGLMLGRVPVDSVSKASAYTYWQGGNTWTSTQPTKASTTNTFIGGAFSTVDIFYSPRHLTFIAVYFDEYTDNDFYAKYLNADKPILPSWAGGPEDDIVQYLTQYTWSKQFLIFQTPPPSTSFNYGGGMNMGYFGANDITRGGNQMLLHWTHPTNEDAGSADTGYELQSAIVTWN